MPLFKKTYTHFCCASSKSMVITTVKMTGHMKPTFTNFMQKEVILLRLPTCLQCSAALEGGTFPLGLSRNIMIHVACDPAFDRPAFCQEGREMAA